MKYSLELSITEKVSSVVAVANRTPAIARMLPGWDRSFALTVDSRKLGIVTTKGVALVLPDAPASEHVWFGMSERTLDLMIAGRLSPVSAKLTGRLRSTGGLVDILRFASIFTACLQQRSAGSSVGRTAPSPGNRAFSAQVD